MKNIILLSLIIATGFCSCENDKNTTKFNRVIDQKTDTIRLLTRRTDTLNKRIDSLKWQATKWFSDDEIDYYKDMGIDDPEDYITSDLMSKPELIPYKGVLGGTMRTWDVSLLGNHWAVAYIEDGHVAGKMLLKYSVTKDKKVKWVVMDSYME